MIRTLLGSFCAVFIAGLVLLAQSPIGMGPGTLSPGLVQLLDWYIATPSGCTAGAREMCVGATLFGDTQYYTAWFADATGLPNTSGLPVIGTANDYTSRTCGGNILILQLSVFSWTTPNGSKLTEVNCMSSYGNTPAATNAPAGWHGHCTSGDAFTDGDCSWKNRTPFVRGGVLYLPVERQIAAGTLSIHDGTMIKSTDGGATWRNPYTVATSGAASATGDAPLCNAAAGGAGNNCTHASYPGSIMWPSLPLALSNWVVVQYGQDGVTPPAGVLDGCDPALYTCFLGGAQEGTIARVLNTDLPSLDVTKYQYYTCPTLTESYRCPGSASSSWTSTFASRTSTMRFVAPAAGNFFPWNELFGVAYIKEFKSYLLTGYQNRTGGVTAANFAWAPSIQGPWTTILSSNAGSAANTVWPGFMSPSLALGYSVVSTNPPHVKLTMVTDDVPAHGISQGTPFFSQWDLVLGKRPWWGSEMARYSNTVGIQSHSGYIVSDSHAPRTIPAKDLVWLWDLYDHGGVTTWSGFSGFREIGTGTAFLVPNSQAGSAFFPSQGTSFETYGAKLDGSGGYSPKLYTVQHETNYTTVNVPAALRGNGSYTVGVVFRVDAFSGATPVWVFGDASGSNTMVALSGNTLELGWGVSGNRWRFLSSFTPTIGNWYFVACTVQANGATPVAHMWVGVGGQLIDKIAGVTRASTGGAPTQTPNIAAGPLTLGLEPGQTNSINASYGLVSVHSRALSQPEAWVMYQSAQTFMAARGVTVQ